MDADFFLVNSKVLALAQRSNAFSLSCGRDGVQEFVLALPPPWVQQLVTENDSDLPAACLAALPVRSPKKGDWRTGLSCALREKLPKKARLCEVLSALEGILDSKKAVMERGRWQVLLVRMEEHVPCAHAWSSRSFPAGGMPEMRRSKRGGRAQRRRGQLTNLRFEFQ